MLGRLNSSHSFGKTPINLVKQSFEPKYVSGVDHSFIPGGVYALTQAHTFCMAQNAMPAW